MPKNKYILFTKANFRCIILLGDIMKNFTPNWKFHFAKDYLNKPLKIGNMELVQIGCTHCTREFNTSSHLHRYNWLEITYVTGGEGVITTNSVPTKVKRGDLYISYPNDIHSIKTDEENLLKYTFLTLVGTEFVVITPSPPVT